MPSYLVGFRSGGELLISGNPWSGNNAQFPVGGVQLELDREASGSIYVAMSGGVTVKSGSFFLSGGGLMDGVQIKPGGSYFIPRIGTGLSGNLTIYIGADPAVSGQGRVYYDIF